MCKLSEEGREGAFQLSDKVRPYKEALACAKPTRPPSRKELGVFRELVSKLSLMRGYGTRAAGEGYRMCGKLEITLKAVGK